MATESLDIVPRILLANIEGMKSRKRKDKMKQLLEMAVEDSVLLIAVTESDLNAVVITSEVDIEGFDLIRTERQEGTKKGGVGLYIRRDIAQLFGDYCGASMHNRVFVPVLPQMESSTLPRLSN